MIVAGIVTNFVGTAAYDGTCPTDITDSAAVGAAASGLRRMGTALYLTGIAFGLDTISEVLRFQAIRIQGVAATHGHGHRLAGADWTGDGSEPSVDSYTA